MAKKRSKKKAKKKKKKKKAARPAPKPARRRRARVKVIKGPRQLGLPLQMPLALGVEAFAERPIAPQPPEPSGPSGPSEPSGPDARGESPAGEQATLFQVN